MLFREQNSEWLRYSGGRLTKSDNGIYLLINLLPNLYRSYLYGQGDNVQ